MDDIDEIPPAKADVAAANTAENGGAVALEPTSPLITEDIPIDGDRCVDVAITPANPVTMVSG